MTLHIEQTMECDACGKRSPIEDVRLWYSVRSVTGSTESAIELTESGRYEKGDFCSLPCVSHWADAQTSLRELDGGLDAP